MKLSITNFSYKKNEFNISISEFDKIHTGDIEIENIKTRNKEVFNFLEEKNEIFIPHKNIPNSSKISDIYLNKFDLWIELDGINREKKKEWLKKDYEYWKEKLDIYHKQKLNLKIVYSFKEFVELYGSLT